MPACRICGGPDPFADPWGHYLHMRDLFMEKHPHYPPRWPYSVKASAEACRLWHLYITEGWYDHGK
jgi:hypothetical protein